MHTNTVVHTSVFDELTGNDSLVKIKTFGYEFLAVELAHNRSLVIVAAIS